MSVDLSNKAFINTKFGGSNKCIVINKKTGYCLPNCVGYCYGRATIAIGKHSLPTCSAENWYKKVTKFEKGSTPKKDSIIVWSKGKIGVGSDGYGHVAYVEKVNSDKSILVSESAYNGYEYKEETIKYPYSRKGYELLGFIYLKDDEEPVETKEETTSKNYKTLMNLYVRVGAGTNYSKKLVKQLTEDGKKNATSTNPNAYALYKKGTVFTAVSIINNSRGTWAKTPSGYVCITGATGTKYCSKV